METTQYGSISPEGIEAMKYTAKMVDSKLFNTWAIHNGWLRYEDTDNGTIRIQIWVVPFGYTVRVNYKDDKIISIQ